MLWHPKTLQILAMYNVFFSFLAVFPLPESYQNDPKFHFNTLLSSDTQKSSKNVENTTVFWSRCETVFGPPPPAKADIATAILTNVIEHLVLLFCPPISTPSPPKRCGRILFFPGKVVAAGDERQLACASGAGALVLSDVFGSYMVFCNVRLRSYRMFWNLWLQIAARWQHDCCHVPLPCAFIHAILPRDVAQRIVMAAWMLHGTSVGEAAGARNIVIFRAFWRWFFATV